MTETTTDKARAGRLMRRASYAAVAVAGTLIAAKFGAWLLTDSISVLSTLVDSLLDIAASVMNLFAVSQALQPADREHRFGHGKAEPLAGLGQSTFIAGSAAFLLIEAGQRLFNPRAVEGGTVGIAVMAFSILLTIALVLYQRRVIARTGSIAISADSLHYKGDLLVNLGVIAALLLSVELGWLWADPVIGVTIAGYILYNAWRIFRDSLDQVMDREFAGPERARIRDIVMRHPEVRAMHDLRTRSSGRDAFIQLHIEMDGDITLYRSHEIADEVEAWIREAFPDAEVLIHQDPEGLEVPPVFR